MVNWLRYSRPRINSQNTLIFYKTITSSQWLIPYLLFLAAYGFSTISLIYSFSSFSINWDKKIIINLNNCFSLLSIDTVCFSFLLRVYVLHCPSYMKFLSYYHDLPNSRWHASIKTNSHQTLLIYLLPIENKIKQCLFMITLSF